jgi:hypothetical protein
MALQHQKPSRGWRSKGEVLDVPVTFIYTTSMQQND